MMRSWRSALRPSRPELLGLAIAWIIGLALLIALIARLAAFGIPATCFAISNLDDPGCLSGGRALRDYLDLVSIGAPITFLALAALAPMTGSLMGLTLVAKEVEQGTTEFAWSIAPSRRRWLVARVAPVLLAIVVIGGAAGVLADALQGQREPSIDAQMSFDNMGGRGPVIAAMALFAFSISLLIGAAAGRVLLAFLLSFLLVGSGLLGLRLASDAMIYGDAIVVVASDELGPGLRIEYLIRTREGEIITYQEAYERFGSAAVDGLDPALGLTQMVRWVPGQVYPLASWRLAALYGFTGLGILAMSFAVVDRRRP